MVKILGNVCGKKNVGVIKQKRLVVLQAFFFVGVTGFEPVTSWSQTKHTNRTVLYPEKVMQK